jgi:DNA modification methylase
MQYQEFLQQKELIHYGDGLDLTITHEKFLEYQDAIVNWALKKGKSAIFADCGLGKSFMAMAILDGISKHINKPALLITPLQILNQFIKEEAPKFGYQINNLRENPIAQGINIINYEMLETINANDYGVVFLDESSILKSLTGKTRTLLIDMFQKTEYKFCGTATPSPNDFMELGNHSEFLGIMTRVEMLAMFFTHDGGDTAKWKLKGHGKKNFWKWLSTWCVVITEPSDIGFCSKNYIKPPMFESQKHMIDVDKTDFSDGYLIPLPAQGMTERIKERKKTVQDRCQYVADLVNNSKEQWLVWCELNSEAEILNHLIEGSENLSGSDNDNAKLRKIDDFKSGKTNCLITKPKIAAFGLNFQHCHNMAFASLSDSYEQFYQAVRRCYRFGQTKVVKVHLVLSETQNDVYQNIQNKHAKAQEMKKALVKEFNESGFNINSTKKENMDYFESKDVSKNYEIYNADCCEVIKRLPDNSLGYSIFSPPFASLYTYSNSDRDMGNCKSHTEFYTHFKFMVDELHKKLMHGRLVSFHCMNLPTSKQNDGFIGIRDFRGELIKIFQDAGFVYHSEVVIWKDPVIAMQRTKALGLLHKQIKKDSCMSRQGIPDYLVTMRKLGDNPKPNKHTGDQFPVSLWQQYASPVWMDINPSKTLQYSEARAEDDERHICPLQLQVIERALDLWTAEGDTVFSPFMGIGSEGYVSLQKGRKFIGTELKPSYYAVAKKNLDWIENNQQRDLFAVGSGEAA